ncbi:hypothetical protein [Sporolactobacillus pectinivorans]|uniref:hypothetical protein n=1 Tax=Sporolactobacillus pectinivorans TaxID=1591408 RepID=UPI000C25A947|nr:hypothetical protein [Sporolactobacillus pectinivorans]
MNKLGTLLKNHELNKAIPYARNLSPANLYDDIVEFIDSDNDNLIWYTVILNLLLEKESPVLHNMLYNIFAFILNNFDGAPDVQLYHARRALELSNEKDPLYPELLCNLLRLNYEPDEMVSDEEAKKIAQKVLEIDPNNDFVHDRIEEGLYK